MLLAGALDERSPRGAVRGGDPHQVHVPDELRQVSHGQADLQVPSKRVQIDSLDCSQGSVDMTLYIMILPSKCSYKSDINGRYFSNTRITQFTLYSFVL